MSREIHIDQYIKEKIETLNVPFDELYWAEAEKLIIEQEKRKRRGFFFWFFMLVLGVFSAAFSFYYYNQQIEQPKSIFNSASKELNKLPLVNENKYTSNIETKAKQRNQPKNPKKKSLIFKTNRANKINLFYADDAKGSSTASNNEDSSNSTTVDSLINRAPSLEAFLARSPSEFNLWLSDEENQKRKFKKNVLLGISAGLTLNNKIRPGYFSSIHVQRMNSSKSFTRIAIQFSALAYSELQYKYKNIDYSFGENITNYTISSNTLYTIQVPVSYHKRVYKSCFVLVGLGYSHYFAQENKVIKESDGTVENSMEYGTSSDFNKNNVFLLTGLETKLFRSYQLGIATQYSMLKPVSNTNKLIERNNNILESRVYLIYHLSRIKK